MPRNPLAPGRVVEKNAMPQFTYASGEWEREIERAAEFVRYGRVLTAEERELLAARRALRDLEYEREIEASRCPTCGHSPLEEEY